ncbi:MAG: PHP domain-containing protein [Spirochaetales bacterium]|nr:PHP domain-containing protein [Spirochaetales bacterium]
MDIRVDLHTHTIMSSCGIHSALEMISAAKEKGLEAIAVTDHGPLLGGRLPSTFFDRFENPIPGIRLLKGVELNLEHEGTGVDIPPQFIPYCDILILGLHETVPSGKDRTYYTERLLAAIEANSFIDGITHPNSYSYPVDYPVLARAAKAAGVALELNNSKVRYKRVHDSETRALIRACIDSGCPVMVNSDSHTVNELGDLSHILALIQEEGLPEHQIVNRSLGSTLEWLDRRKKFKKETN